MCEYTFRVRASFTSTVSQTDFFFLPPPVPGHGGREVRLRGECHRCHVRAVMSRMSLYGQCDTPYNKFSPRIRYRLDPHPLTTGPSSDWNLRTIPPSRTSAPAPQARSSNTHRGAGWKKATTNIFIHHGKSEKEQQRGRSCNGLATRNGRGSEIDGESSIGRRFRLSPVTRGRHYSCRRNWLGTAL